ncbi:protein aardvark [Anaeramoeba ignava]|nr:protein aardvark [Anaeramoeba ignava]
MKFHPKNGELQANACGSLWNLAVNEENKRIIAQNQGIKLILNSMINHKNNEKVLKYACGALANIASIEENIEQLKNQQLKEILDFIFQNYSNEPSIIKQATRLSTRIN